jgi:hypothetical protein
MYTIKNCEARSLTDTELKKCKSLSFRSEGHMTKLLLESKYYPEFSYDCYLIMDKNETLLSWALVAKEEAHFYTRKTYRGRGLASMLAKEINKKYKQEALKSDIHDEVSEKFLSKYKYKRIYKENE